MNNSRHYRDRKKDFPNTKVQYDKNGKWERKSPRKEQEQLPFEFTPKKYNFHTLMVRELTPSNSLDTNTDKLDLKSDLSNSKSTSIDDKNYDDSKYNKFIESFTIRQIKVNEWYSKNLISLST